METRRRSVCGEWRQMSQLVVQNLSKVFGRRSAEALRLVEQGTAKDEVMRRTGATVGVYDVSFELKPGEIFVVMGLSGSGKSTLLRCLNMLQPPTAGKIYLGDQELTSLDEKDLREVRRTRFGMVFQRFALLPHRTVIGNVEFGLEVRGVDAAVRRAEAEKWLDLVGLKGWGERYPHELSGGMQQRVGLARALAVDPEILLMDEAFSALDPLIRRDMQDELLSLQEQLGKTIIFITHDLDEALKLGDRIAVMRDGVFIQVGTGEEIISEPADDYVAAFTRGVDRSKVLTAGAVMQPSRTTAGPNDGPKTMLQRMKRHAISSIFIVDRGRRLQGIVHAEDVAEAAQSGRPLEQYMETDLTVVQEDTPMDEVIRLGANMSVPIAVVDDENRLRGVIVKGAILATLAQTYQAEGDSHEGSGSPMNGELAAAAVGQEKSM